VDPALRYTLKGGKPVPCESLQEWNAWLETRQNVVAQTDVRVGFDMFLVSTVFYGVNMSFDADKPIFFETSVFMPEVPAYAASAIETKKYATLEEAQKGHEEMIGRVQRLEIWPPQTIDNLE